MKELPWEPRVKNKYNLTIEDITNLKVGKYELVKPPLFWWNNVISAWCILGSAEHESTFWIGIYPQNAPKNSGEFKFYLTCYESWGVCFYTFKEFYVPEDIENKYDLMIQEKFLEKINELIDKGILVKP